MSTQPPWLLIRADASREMGAGHVMRCLALAQAWRKRGGRCQWMSRPLAPALVKRIKREAGQWVKLPHPPGSMKDAAWVASAAQRLDKSWVVVDGYHFTTGYQQKLKKAGARVLVIDDHGQAGRYAADVILDQNLTAQTKAYRQRPRSSRLLLGLSYGLLRQEFIRASKAPSRKTSKKSKILVTLGGSDPDNVTQTVLESLALATTETWEILVILGADNPHEVRLRQYVRKMKLSVKFLRQTNEMPRWMNWADWIVTGAGSTVWETILMQRPSVVLSLAENQRPIAEHLQRRGLALYARITARQNLLQSLTQKLRRLSQDPVLGQRLVTCGRHAVDGRGASRVVEALWAELR